MEYHRQIIPHNAMKRNHPEVVCMYEVPNETQFAFDRMSDEELSTYDIFCFLRQVNSDKGGPIERCHALGCKVVFDIDDYWNLPPDHAMKRQGQDFNYPEKVVGWMKQSDLVTTTTQYFKEVIHHCGVKKVAVLPNCVDGEAPQFKDITPTESSLVRFGWIGGVHHLPDLELIEPTFKSFGKNRASAKGMQFVLGGFTPNKYYIQIEKIMTSNYRLFGFDKNYIDYLKEFTPTAEHISLHKPYRRIWGTGVEQYATLYNEIDVALIPLRGNKFSACKSELKLIEAGWFKKPVICSDTLPYNNVIEHGKNGFLIRGEFWGATMKKLMDKNLREDIGEALHETIKKRYDVNEWAKKRYEIYSGLI